MLHITVHVLKPLYMHTCTHVSLSVPYSYTYNIPLNTSDHLAPTVATTDTDTQLPMDTIA